MSEIQLSTSARQALIGLLLHQGEATNPMLKERFHLASIAKQERDALVKQGLITTRTGLRNATVHTLTQKGWERSRHELTTVAPDKGSGIAWMGLLYGALGVLDRLMTERDLTVKHVFSASGNGNGSPSEDLATDDRAPEDQVIDAYSKLAKRPGDLVSLVHLRDSLTGISKEELDRVLKAMDRQRTIQLEPDANRKALPPEAHEAAISIGGEDKHLITIGRA